MISDGDCVPSTDIDSELLCWTCDSCGGGEAKLYLSEEVEDE